jgi:TonB family protein
MDSKRTRRFLIVAFALSLLIHLIVTLFARWPFQAPTEEVQVVSITHVHTTRIAHAPTPPPHTPQPAPSVVATAPPRKVAMGTGRGAVTAPSAAPTPLPTPVPTVAATPNCTTNDSPVELVATPGPPDIAPGARADAANGITRVRVIVGPQGAVESATVVASSGSSSMDLVAVGLARAAQYAPATHACKAIASDYTFSVRWAPW